MDKRKDYYTILGVARDATTADIKRAYRRLAKRYHPDKTAGTSPEEFRILQAAYATLADADRRQRYDEELSPLETRREPFPFQSRGASDLRRPVRPGALTGEIILSASEARAGGVMPVEVPLETSCANCQGTGGAAFDCEWCGGEGKTQRRLPLPLRIPPRVRNGAVFQVCVDDPAVVSVFLTVYISPV